jgi:hypothetical protein
MPLLEVRQLAIAYGDGDVTLVPALDHLRPRLQPVWREPPYRKDQVVVGDDFFQGRGQRVRERAHDAVVEGEAEGLDGQEDRWRRTISVASSREPKGK